MSLRAAVVSQFREPRGALGHLAGWVMARRASNRQRIGWTVDLLGLDPGDRVLEFGCGPGVGLALCAPRLSSGCVVGLDHSQVMLDQAARRNRAAVGCGRARLQRGGLEALPGLGGGFDKVFSSNVIQFLPDKVAAFRAFHGAMIAGGIVATTYLPRRRGATRETARAMAEEVATAMTTAGFAAIRTAELPLEPVPAVCVLGAAARG